MPKLNFYDTDAVKAFVLNILVENEELRQSNAFLDRQSNVWFQDYRTQKERADAAPWTGSRQRRREVSDLWRTDHEGRTGLFPSQVRTRSLSGLSKGIVKGGGKCAKPNY